MNIAVNARLLLNHRMEGVARYCWEITQCMIRNYPEHHFFLFFDRAYDASFHIAENMTCISLFPQARHPILWKWWFDFSLPNAFRKHNIDVFFSGDGFMSLRTSVPTLLVSHDIAYLHFPSSMKKGHLKYYQKFVPIFHRKAQHIIAVSHSTKDDILKHFGLEPKKITVAYNALPSTIPLGLNPKNKSYFLYLGSIHPRKNIVNLLLAFDIFVQRLLDEKLSPPSFIIAGRQAFGNEKVKSTFSTMRHRSFVEFKGPVSEEEKWTLLAEATALCYISKWEGFGIPILEAMHAKTPVLTSSEGAQKEVAGDAALVADPHNIDSIAENMYVIFTDEKQRSILIEKGKERVKAFNWEKSAKIIFEELTKLAVS